MIRRLAEQRTYPANRAAGRRVVAGELAITGREIRFTPHRYHKSGEWIADLDEIRGIDKAPLTFGPFNGGLRHRLRLTFEDGQRELFVVNDLDQVIAEITPLADAVRSRPSG